MRRRGHVRSTLLAWPTRRRGYAVTAGAAVLFASVLCLQLTEPSASAAVVLLSLPVALVALSLGAVAGLVAAIIAIGLLGIWALAGGDPGGWLGYLAAALAYFTMGAGVGWWAAKARAAHREVADALDSALDGVVITRRMRNARGAVVDGRVVYCNAVAADFFGRAAEDIVGKPFSLVWPDVFGPELLQWPSHHVHELLDYEVRLDGPDGARPIVVDLRATSYEDGVIVAWREVSERHRQERAVARATAEFAAAFEYAPFGMVLIDAKRRIMRANPSFAAMSGRQVDELVGCSLDELLDPRDVRASREDFASLIAGGAARYHRERRLLRPDGDIRWVSVGVARVGEQQDAYVVEHFEDIHERKSYEGRLQFLADHDPLTGLFNRRRFAEELSEQLARDGRYGGTSAVLLIDLDNFKYINDTLGHAAGDSILEVIARALRLRLRDSDVIGRLGGDEFAVLLPDADPAQAAAVAATLLAGIRHSEVEHGGQRVRTTGSIGIAVSGETEADELLSNADLALYAAKDAGRNTYVMYDPLGPHAAWAHIRFRWLDRVRDALENDLFVLEAQPIVNLSSGALSGCELLLRMREGNRLVAPGTFLPIAERHGLANPVDRLVVAHAIEIAAAHAQPPPFRWEINLSADSLADNDLPDLIERELARTGVPAASVAFEITETAAITSLDLAQKFAARITQTGCRFALDDFGAGYGSFYYLKHLPFTYLKIDGEFIRQLSTNTTDQVIVQAIVTAARALGKQTIAEYVEDADTEDLLRSYLVDEAQGYFVGRPGDPQQLTLFSTRR